MNRSLYVHMPFCRKKCNYCDFPSYAAKEALVPAYLKALSEEAKLVSSGLESTAVDTVFVGGGTPTLLSAESLSELFGILRRSFEIVDAAEISVEANPGTVTREKLKVLKGIGVNRISLGAQSFSNEILRKLGRIHLSHETIEAFELIREAGFGNVNLDLIFAVPGQSALDWRDTLARALALKPEHVSAYNLQIEEGTPFHAEKLEGLLKLPDEEKELEMYKLAIDELKSKGYRHYEISNFAKPGYECRHNITYWTLRDYIGIGCGAHSYVGGTRFENSANLDEYLKMDFEKSRKLHRNSKNEDMQEFIFLGLRMLDGFDLTAFTERFGKSFRELYRKEIADLKDAGLMEISGKRARLTEKGLYLGNEVFKAFL